MSTDGLRSIYGEVAEDLGLPLGEVKLDDDSEEPWWFGEVGRWTVEVQETSDAHYWVVIPGINDGEDFEVRGLLRHVTESTTSRLRKELVR